MALQMIYVDDAAPGACGDAGMVYNGTTTITSSKIIAGTSMTMSGTAAITGNTSVGGTMHATGATTCGSTLGVTGNVAVNTNKFNVSSASGNTAIAGTLTVTGASTFHNAVSLGSAEYIGQSGLVPVPLDCLVSTFTTSAIGLLMLSLADGAEGQMLIVMLDTKHTNNAVMTPANAFGFTTLTFDASHERAMLVFCGGAWHIIYTNATVS